MLPKALGGEAGEDFQELEDGNKRNKHTTLKKRKNKEILQEEAKKQDDDAHFLEELFQDDLSHDTDQQQEVRYDQYKSIKKNINKNKDLGNNFLDALNLPKFDPNENP